MVTLVAARHRDSLLPALRASTAGAHDLLWCVAFVSVAGVHLLARELEAVPGRKRLLATGVFGGDASQAALAVAAGLGIDVRVLNLGGGTYHPKVYLFEGHHRQALVGSPNLTGGLISNVEAALWLDGSSGPALDELWEFGEELWAHPAATPWTQASSVRRTESMSELLFAELLAAIPEGSDVRTLAGGRPNRVVAVTADALWAETDRSRVTARGAQPVPGWMLQLAYDWLRSHGTLSNLTLLNELRVHRSSFVCAALSCLPNVEVRSRSPIELGWRGHV